MAKITKIEIEAGGKTLKLTVEEFIKLRDELNRLYVAQPYVPYVPYVPYYPIITYVDQWSYTYTDDNT